MIRQARHPFLFFFLVICWTGFGQSDGFMKVQDPAAIKNQITKANAGISSLACDFNQEKELSFLEEKVSSSGKFYYQKENKIRWEYDIPYSYIIIMNGSLIKIQDEDKSNTLDASANRLFGSINAVMSGIIDGSVINREDQFKSTFSENEKSVRVSLVPAIEGMKEFISSIEIDMNKKDFTVDALRIIEKNGDYTLIRFSNKKFNETLPDTVFSVN